MLIVVCINIRPALHAQNFHVLDISDSKDAYPGNNFFIKRFIINLGAGKIPASDAVLILEIMFTFL